MRKTLALSLVVLLCITGFDPFPSVSVSAPRTLLAATEQEPGGAYYVQFTPEQLDNLVAPIALYPDPLLAQVLLASTFVDQVSDGAQWLRSGNDPRYVDTMPWDVSVKAVAHYPRVLYMMADKIDWTASLGQAYVSQSTDVMVAVQRLRRMARSAGYLVAGPQQRVYVEAGYVRVVPVQPALIFVPVYNPAIVYYPRPAGVVVAASVISFGVGFAIGAWLNHDCDWGGNRVYYHGWQGGGWIANSRNTVNVTNNVYVNNSYQNVTINRTVINRNVNYNNLNTNYNSIHRNVTYNNVNRTPNPPQPVPQQVPSSQMRPQIQGGQSQQRQTYSHSVTPGTSRDMGTAQPGTRSQVQGVQPQQRQTYSHSATPGTSRDLGTAQPGTHYKARPQTQVQGAQPQSRETMSHPVHRGAPTYTPSQPRPQVQHVQSQPQVHRVPQGQVARSTNQAQPRVKQVPQKGTTRSKDQSKDRSEDRKKN